MHTRTASVHGCGSAAVRKKAPNRKSTFCRAVLRILENILIWGSGFWRTDDLTNINDSEIWTKLVGYYVFRPDYWTFLEFNFLNKQYVIS